ncbi:hypothetical protein B0H14DRAFT_3901589 [Mycena olivaceomarginata]|nr:hypothetical protein B0H14DRAFT_3901589 [Mycena olivaceomarginata]
MCVLVDKGACTVIFWALYCHSLSVLVDLVTLMHLCPLAGYLCTHGAPHLESLCLMRCDACAAHAPGALPLHPHVAQLSVPQLVRLLSTSPRSPASPAPAVPHLTSVALAPPPPQASRPSTPSPPVHTLALEDASHPVVTVPADAAPLLACVFAPIAHLELVSANPVVLAIEATKTRGAVDHAATGVALQALVGAALGACTGQRDALTTEGVHTLVRVAPRGHRARCTTLLLAHIFALARFPGLAHLATRPLRVACLELVSADPAVLAIEATGTVCVRGSPGPFAIGAGSGGGGPCCDRRGAARGRTWARWTPAATGATLQALGARGGTARCVEAVYAGAAHAHGGVPEEYLLCVLVFWRAEGDADRDRDTVNNVRIAAGNVLDAFAVVDPTKIITKIKLHLLAHLPEDITAFGPLE